MQFTYITAIIVPLVFIYSLYSGAKASNANVIHPIPTIIYKNNLVAIKDINDALSV